MVSAEGEREGGGNLAILSFGFRCSSVGLGLAAKEVGVFENDRRRAPFF